MNRSKIMFVTLLLMSGFACAMNDDDDNPNPDDALNIVTHEMAQLDLNDPEPSIVPTSEIVEDPFAHMISHCCSRGFESVVLREQFVESVRNRPKDEQFFSPEFISTIISKVHSREYSYPGGYVLSVAFDPTGTLLATGCRDRKARIIDRETGKCLGEFPHENWVRSVAFDPKGTLLATGCEDNKARIIDRETGNCLDGFPHKGWVNSVAFDPKGTLLATGCIDNKARIIDRETGKCLDEFPHKGWVRSVAFDPTGKLLATGSDRKARIIDRETGNCLGEFPHKNSVLSVAFDPRGTLLATGCRDRKARIIAIENGNCLYEFPHKNWVRSVAFDPTGKWLATGCDDRKARIWNLLVLRTAREILILPDNLPQLYLLQACEIAMQEKQYVCLTDEQLKIFSALPERIQNVLRIYTVTPEQYKRIKKIT